MIPAGEWTLENLLTLFHGNRCRVLFLTIFQVATKKGSRFEFACEKSELMTILKSQSYSGSWQIAA